MDTVKLKKEVRRLMIEANVTYFQFNAVNIDGDEITFEENVGGSTEKHIKLVAANSMTMANKTLLVLDTRR